MGRKIILEHFKITCKCGNEFDTTSSKLKDGRGVYCSKKCMYIFRVRPKGLNYDIKNDNSGWFIKGERSNIEYEFQKGRIPQNFKEEGVSYGTLHDWVSYHKVKPLSCEHCGLIKKRIEWANKSHEYKRDIEDWIAICKKCHIKYDRESGKWGVAAKKFNIKSRRKKHGK